MKFLYVLIHNEEKCHFGAFIDDVKARVKARQFEKDFGLKFGSIDIYEIPEHMIDFEGL